MQGSAAVKVRTQFTQSFDFTKAKTWSWQRAVRARSRWRVTADDDPEVVRKRAEPMILERSLPSSPNVA